MYDVKDSFHKEFKFHYFPSFDLNLIFQIGGGEVPEETTLFCTRGSDRYIADSI